MHEWKLKYLYKMVVKMCVCSEQRVLMMVMMGPDVCNLKLYSLSKQHLLCVCVWFEDISLNYTLWYVPWNIFDENTKDVL